MAKIKALMNYKDNYEGKEIKEGDVYDTTEERAKQITSSTYHSLADGKTTKYAEYTEEEINVGWQKPNEEEKEEPVVESVEENIEEPKEVVEEPKEEVKPKKKRKTSKAK